MHHLAFNVSEASSMPMHSSRVCAAVQAAMPFSCTPGHYRKRARASSRESARDTKKGLVPEWLNSVQLVDSPHGLDDVADRGVRDLPGEQQLVQDAIHLVEVEDEVELAHAGRLALMVWMMLRIEVSEISP